VQLAKLLQQRRQFGAGEGGHGGDCEPAPAQGESVVQVVQCTAPVRQQALGHRQELAALRGECQGAGGPCQQATANGLLQIANGNAQCGLGQVEQAASLGEAAAAGHRDESSKLLYRDVHAGSSSQLIKIIDQFV